MLLAGLGDGGEPSDVENGLNQVPGKDEVQWGEVSFYWEKGTETRGRVGVGAGQVGEKGRSSQRL